MRVQSVWMDRTDVFTQKTHSYGLWIPLFVHPLQGKVPDSHSLATDRSRLRGPAPPLPAPDDAVVSAVGKKVFGLEIPFGMVLQRLVN
jgi:hypothetical protein